MAEDNYWRDVGDRSKVERDKTPHRIGAQGIQEPCPRIWGRYRRVGRCGRTVGIQDLGHGPDISRNNKIPQGTLARSDTARANDWGSDTPALPQVMEKVQRPGAENAQSETGTLPPGSMERLLGRVGFCISLAEGSPARHDRRKPSEQKPCDLWLRNNLHHGIEWQANRITCPVVPVIPE